MRLHHMGLTRTRTRNLILQAGLAGLLGMAGSENVQVQTQSCSLNIACTVCARSLIANQAFLLLVALRMSSAQRPGKL